MNKDSAEYANYRRWVILLAALGAIAFQGTRGLIQPSEGRYAEAGREMVETGDLLVPTLDYRPHWTKPPLTYYAIAAGIIIFGDNEWGARAYNALAFFLTVLLVGQLGRELWGPAAGLMASLVYVSSPFPFFAANAVTTDSLLALWVCTSAVCYLKACREQGGAQRLVWTLGMWAAWGLGFLTKGPALILPAFAIVCHYVWTRRSLRILHPLGILLFLAIGTSWYAAVIAKHPDLLSFFLKEQFLDRFSSNQVHNRHWYSPLKTYLPVITAGAGWWLFPGLFILARKKLYSPGVLWKKICSSERAAFLFLWFALPFLIFCFARSRLPLYLLPVYAPVALAMVPELLKKGFPERVLRGALWAAAISVLVMCCAKYIAARVPLRRNMNQLYQLCQPYHNDQTVFLGTDLKGYYGLQFYLKGNLKRVALTRVKPEWARLTLEEVLGGIQQGKPPGPRTVFVVSRKHQPELEQALRGAQVKYVVQRDSFWAVLIIPPSALPAL